VGITLLTLQRWIKKRKVKAPRLRVVRGRAMRLWVRQDVTRLREIKKKIYGRVGRPRKKKKA
jgi:predicted site-specific integrase-resolvase